MRLVHMTNLSRKNISYVRDGEMITIQQPDVLIRKTRRASKALGSRSR
jgi:hypothetical protein